MNANINPSLDVIERLKINLPVLLNYYKEIGNEEAQIGIRNELEKVNSLKI